MSDNELLLAISETMEKTLDKKLDETLEEKLDKLLDKKLAPVNERLTRIELTQENEILPRLQNMEELYVSTYRRYADSVADHERMKVDIDLLKKVVAGHSEKLQKLA